MSFGVNEQVFGTYARILADYTCMLGTVTHADLFTERARTTVDNPTSAHHELAERVRAYARNGGSASAATLEIIAHELDIISNLQPRLKQADVGELQSNRYIEYKEKSDAAIKAIRYALPVGVTLP